MSIFSVTWDTEVKKLALDCVREPRFVQILEMGEDHNLTTDEKEYFESIEGKYKDLAGMYHISDMIWRVEHALADDREDLAKFAIINIYRVITSDSYLENLFESDKTNIEWKRIEALANGLAKLISIRRNI